MSSSLFKIYAQIQLAAAMELKDDIQEAFQTLGLSDLPSDWVDSLWDGDFCPLDTVTLPYLAVGEGVLLCEESWEAAVKACKQWLQDSDGDESMH